MPRSLFSELKRRHVWRAAALYAAAAWLLVQVAGQVLPLFDVSNAVLRGIVIVLILGFPFWIAFAWLYELTPEGIKRESEIDPAESMAPRTGRILDRWIFGIMGAAIVLLLANTLVWHRGAGVEPKGAEAASAPSIAVLPFENLSSDREQAYFADGISEDVLDLLTKIPALRVAARTSSFAFKGKDVSADSIAHVLRVANLLQGSVQRAGDEVRISVQLVRAADGYVVWSDRWDRKLENVFAIQDEIARNVAEQLQVKLLGAPAAARPTTPAAYALFLQAREVGRQLRPDALLRSDSLYRQVLALDARYAPAWTGLAENSINETLFGVLPNQAGLRQAQAAVRKALAIDPRFAGAYSLLGVIAAQGADLAGAARELERALALDPTNIDVLAESGGLLANLGRLKEAAAVQEYVAARDPLNVNALVGLGFCYYWAGRYDDAIARFRTVLNLSPGRGGAHAVIGLALLLKGDRAAALAEMQLETVEAWRLADLAIVYHALGRGAMSDSVLTELTRKGGAYSAIRIASIYAYRDETDRALAWLERAVESHDQWLAAIAVDPLFDPIRGDPRWLPFLRRLGMAPEQLAKIPFQVPVPQSSTAPGP